MWGFASSDRLSSRNKAHRQDHRSRRLRLEPLEDRIALTTLPAGFAESLVSSGLTEPTSMAVAPDGRIFVTEQNGAVRVIKNGALLPTPFMSLSVDATGERGLLGLAFDPNFATNQFVYVYYTTSSPTTHNRVSRFTANGDVVAAASEVQLMDLETLTAGNHNGGALHFGVDGKLYIAVGENAVPSNSQTLANRLGKVLRINSDGSIPTDNPFVNTANGVNRSIWALGLRNPFTFAVQPGSGRIFVNDVGQGTWEEINNGVAGGNYGWPNHEGPENDPAFIGPLFAYRNGSGVNEGRAIAGGVFYNPATRQFPTDFVGDYFFADLTGGFIRRLDPATGVPTDFATDVPFGTVDLDLAPDGSLLYLTRGSGSVMRIGFTATGPSLVVAPSQGMRPLVRVLEASSGIEQASFLAYHPDFGGGVRVATGDVNGDTIPDIITAPGPGGGPHIRVFDGNSGNVIREFFAYNPFFTGGVYVAAADFNGDNRADIVTSAGTGGGPHIRIFSGAGGELGGYFAYDPAFQGGVQVATGDIDGNGTPDIITGAGPGGGPHVRVFSGVSGAQIAGPLGSFFPYNPAFGGGVFVAAGELNGDGRTDVITGAGAGGGPHVRAFSGLTGGSLASFFAYNPFFQGGVRVAAANIVGDGRAEIITGAGPGGGPHVRLFDGVTGSPQGGLFAFDPAFTGGIFVSGRRTNTGSGLMAAAALPPEPESQQSELIQPAPATRRFSQSPLIAEMHADRLWETYDDVEDFSLRDTDKDADELARALNLPLA